MTLALSPDVEKVVSRFIREHPDIIALGARVNAHPPSDTSSSAWVLVTQLDGPSNLAPEHLVGAYLQFDVYATEEGGQPEVNLLARTLRAVLSVMKYSAHDGAVVTGVEINGDARIPDTDFEPARDRRAITATVWIHG